MSNRLEYVSLAGSNKKCCLCCVDLMSSKGKSRQKKLKNCTAEKKRLQECIDELCNGDSLEFDRESFLCYECLLKLGKLIRCEREIEQIKKEMAELFEKLGSNCSMSNKRASRFESTLEAKKAKHSTMSSSGSPAVSVSIGKKEFQVTTPTRKAAVKSYIRKSYQSFSKKIVKSQSENIVRALGNDIKQEFIQMCAAKHSSTIMNGGENIKTFSWNNLWLELQQHMPLFTSLLNTISSQESQLLNCVVICMFLKKKHQRMALLQRIISAFLYANGAPKLVYNCLQPLMLCQSYEATLTTIDGLVENYDQLPRLWKNNLVQYIHSSKEQSIYPEVMFLNSDNSSDSSSTLSEYSFDAPPYSPISTVSSTSLSDLLLADVDQEVNNQESSNTGLMSNVATNQWDVVHHLTPHESSSVANVNQEDNENDAYVSDLESSNTGLMSNVATDQQDVVGHLAKWHGFKIVGDNIDKNFRPSFQRHNNKTNSMHAFHMYAVQDRIDFSSYSDATSATEVDVSKLLITKDAVNEVLKDVVSLLSRILVQHLPTYNSQAKDVVYHIPSKYTKEMSTKSTVVPLGILQRNENKVEEMCDIMDKIHDYVPSKHVVETFPLFEDDDDVEIDEEMFHQILLGGDQLTIARARGSIAARQDHRTRRERLEGLFPVVEDWHAKQCLLKAIWKHLFKKSSSAEKATLSQFKILLNCRASIDPESNMKGCEDFFLIMLHAHVIAAARKLLSVRQYSTVKELAKAIIENFVSIDPDEKVQRDDKVHLYGTQVLTLAIIWHYFNDSIREGDGDRVLTCWKFLLVIFKAKGHRNYCKEAIMLLAQYHCLLSQRKAAQVKWSRFVNTKGKQGCNVPCDLHLEHLNRRLKGLIRELRSNVSQKVVKDNFAIYPNNAINRAARSIGVLHEICEVFEEQSSRKFASGNHNAPSLLKDVEMVVKVLEDEDVFGKEKGRKHPSFDNFNVILQQCPSKHLEKWISTKVKTYKF